MSAAPSALDGQHVPGIVHAGQQRLDAEVNPDRRTWPGVPLRDGAVGFHRERHEPALSRAGDRGGQDAGGPGFELARQLAGGPMGANYAEAREGDRSARAAHDTRPEPEGVLALAAFLDPGESQPPAPAHAAGGP